MTPTISLCFIKVYRSEEIAIDVVRIPAEVTTRAIVHYRKCAGFLVYRGVLAVVVEGFANRYVRADTGPVFIPAGVVYSLHTLSEVNAVAFYRATPDNFVSDDDIHMITEEVG
jgi:hypothetical protein